ncbi:hypothetical protein CSB45_01455 [candidate division KSB3 bacterium]|uniref:Roadblock/LAMTOR2 domain-containing protein n=1 Tax=candidate division KSB3 bacterium TaxID=2044937 RepID=A0A2G6EAI6_9BACT|nr:MAG: hypothetical protein CSB45_01455 [candidate division KSB3 bacterium]PIE30738.1 MAG: hypothetical protein CSA57_01895 [candidate division KSB3 bacterium]
MANISESLAKAMQIDGAIGVALVDFKSGMCLGTEGGGRINMQLAAAGNTEVVRAKKKVRDKLGIEDKIEDILITLEAQYHLIRMLHSSTTVFLYLILDRGKSNLALARLELEKIDKNLDM